MTVVAVVVVTIIAIVVVAFVWRYLQDDDSKIPQGHNTYFSRLNQHLKQQAPGYPLLIVDLDRVDHNIARVRARLGDTSRVRVALKSLPSLELVAYILDKLGSRRIMAFHSPFVLAALKRFPRADILIGKPFPVAVFTDLLARYQQCVAEKPGHCGDLNHIQWLIDTPERLDAYLQLAQEQKRQLLINIEVDVGLHRGGAATTQDLDKILGIIASHPESLKLSGLMGYDAHMAKLPVPEKLQVSAATLEKRRVAKRYRNFSQHIREHWPALWKKDLTLNGAGSYTYQTNTPENWGGCNDITIGSGFVKASDFETPLLADHQPALFIATRILKKSDQVVLPLLESMSNFWPRLFSSWHTSFFIYGGWWMADPCSPVGLQINPLYGRSTNQELLTARQDHGLGVDDYIFLRPHQSEFVMLQFGALRMVRAGKVVAEWPVLKQYPAVSYEAK